MLISPIQHLEMIEPGRAAAFLIRHEHKMGPCRRPRGKVICHGLFAHGALRAVTVTAEIVGATCASLTRAQTIELARLCADGPSLNRVMLRLWREFVFPAFNRDWAVSYQDETLHTGNIYRFDGWTRIAVKQHSGTDRRTGRGGRDKSVWAWANKERAAV
jgi:hypothetical protein